MFIKNHAYRILKKGRCENMNKTKITIVGLIVIAIIGYSYFWLITNDPLKVFMFNVFF